MTTYKGKLHETVERFPNTDIWIDSCGEKELNYALNVGAVGATSNPVIVGSVIKSELSIWEPFIKDLINEMPSADEEEITWELIYRIGSERSQRFLEAFEKFKGKKGRLSLQTNAKYYRNKEKMIAQTGKIDSLAANMQVKMPTAKAGIEAFEEATYRGISINATVSFTVAQAIAVAEAVERGIKRRQAEGLSIDNLAPVCTLMVGRTDDWVKKYVAQNNIVVNPMSLEWAGIAVFKEAYRLYQERGYHTRLLSAAYRSYLHWSELVGGDLAMTIPFKWFKMINECDIPVEDRIHEPVPAEHLEELKKIPDFIKAFDENALAVEDFVHYGAFKDTIQSFISSYDDLLKVVRSYMIV